MSVPCLDDFTSYEEMMRTEPLPTPEVKLRPAAPGHLEPGEVLEPLIVPIEPVVDRIPAWLAVVTAPTIPPLPASPDPEYQPVLCPFHDTPQ